MTSLLCDHCVTFAHAQHERPVWCEVPTTELPGRVVTVVRAGENRFKHTTEAMMKTKNIIFFYCLMKLKGQTLATMIFSYRSCFSEDE